MNQKTKDALIAFANRKKKIDIPQLNVDVYMRPIPYDDFFRLLAEADGDTDEEREANGDYALCAFSMVDEDSNPIFDPKEYSEWIKKIDYMTALNIVKSRNELNDFSGLDSETKKK